MESSASGLFSRSVTKGSTTVSVRVGNRGLLLANVSGVWVLPVVDKMVPAFEVFNGSKKPIAVPILVSRLITSSNIWLGGAADPSYMATDKMWGVDAGSTGIFGAFMFDDQTGMPFMVYRTGQADYCLAGPHHPNTVQIYQRTVKDARDGLAPTQQEPPKLLHKSTDMMVPIPHTPPGAATYDTAELVVEFVLIGRDRLPANHQLQAEANGWEYELPPKA